MTWKRELENDVETWTIPNPVNFAGQVQVNGVPIDLAALEIASLTASRAIVTDSNGVLAISTTTAAELAYVHNVTSAIQTQLDLKAPLASPTFTGSTNFSPASISSTGTTNVVSITSNLTAASGVLRGLYSLAEFSGTQTATLVNCYAIRGYSKISGTLTSSNGYAAGVQGKVEVSGTLGSGSRVTAVLAQLNTSGGTLSGGEFFGLWVDNQMTTKGSAVLHMVGVENTVDSVTADEMFFVYGRANYLFSLGGPTIAYLNTTAAIPTTSGGQIKISTPAGDRFIPLYSTSI